MLLWLARLSNWISALNVFQYTTFRAVMAALTALAFSLLLGPWTIRKLTALKVGQAVRSDGPQTHLVKNGTPTMGGSLILTAITLSTLLWANLANPYIWILLIVLLATGALGFYDDWRKVVYKDPNGVSARFKMVWQSTVALGAGFALFYLAKNNANNILIVPFFKQVALPLGVVGFIVLTYLTIVGTSNAVNLTDGLDGLAAFPVVLVAGGLGVFVVQRLPRASVYGRCGRVGIGRGVGHSCRDYSPRICVGDYGRLVCDGSDFRDAASGLVQKNQKTHFPDGADSSPLRAKRLERNASGGTLLDYHHCAGVDWVEHVED